MQIIVVGCGKIGSQFAQLMSMEGHEVAVVDNNSQNFKYLGPNFNGVTVLGVPIDEDVLKNAGIESADGFVAVTPNDNINMMACQIAKEMFHVPHIFARIQDPLKDRVFYQFGVHTVCTTNMAVQEFRALMLGEDVNDSFYIDNMGIEFNYELVKEEHDGKPMKSLQIRKDKMLFGLIKEGKLHFYEPNLKMSYGDEIVIVSKI